jgi:hypothetical protein
MMESLGGVDLLEGSWVKRVYLGGEIKTMAPICVSLLSCCCEVNRPLFIAAPTTICHHRPKATGLSTETSKTNNQNNPFFPKLFISSILFQ